MDADHDVTVHNLTRRIHALEAENLEYKKNQDVARKNEFRVMGVVLLAIGAAISLLSYPASSYSNLATVFLMVGVGSAFLGILALFFNTEKIINQKVAVDLSLSSITALDDFLRDMRLKSKGVYIPSSKTNGATRIFMPLRREYELPPEAKLKEDAAFLIGLSNPAQEGVFIRPLGYHLFKYTSEDLGVTWKEPRGHEATPDQERERERPQQTLTNKLREVLVNGLDITEEVRASYSGSELSVRLHNTSYVGMCQSIRKEAPQVCEQIGCPICSLIACIYTEYTDRSVQIVEEHCEERDIALVCQTL
jgi:hypothetical protein